MLQRNLLLTTLLGMNIALLLALLYQNMFSKDRLAQMEQRIRMKTEYNFDDLIPTITYAKDDRVDVGFRPVVDPSNQRLTNCINPEVQDPKLRLEAMRACLPLFREHRSPARPKGRRIVKDIPDFVPKFGEARSVSMHYPYKDIRWKDLYRTPLRSINLLNKLGFYSNAVRPEMYDDDPNVGPDFETPNLGIFNMGDYCNVHDILIQYNPALALTKKYFVTDYHQLGLPRMFVMSKIGEDLMPKISKNMNKLNFYQKLYAIDFRANMFFFKKASFHSYHLIGKNFACFGQSYNHIPGHGALIRKDLLNEFTNNWIQQFNSQPKCKAQLNYFPAGYRLYMREECTAFFKLIMSKSYRAKKEAEPIQFIMKVGHGVHRGAGVELLDEKLEKSYLDLYNRGKNCGNITDNILAQQYIGNPLLYKGHKFDFRIYMMISSVNPFKIYYHDGFLRVSLFKYSDRHIYKAAEITNTELSKKIIKECEKYNKTHEGMTADELREFQFKTLDELSDYLNESGKVNNTNWANDYLRPQFQRAFLSAGKMIEHRVYNSSNVFEIYGVDFVIDDNLDVFIIEVNASPMIVGTNRRKTELMSDMLTGVFNITFAQQFSRTKRALNFIQENKKKIKNASSDKKLSKIKREFRRAYRNDVSPEYAHMLENNPWKMVYDGSKTGTDAYLGMITDNCARLVDKTVSKGESSVTATQ